jgi:hypothetical protein
MKNVVDLVPSEDGSYVPKNSKKEVVKQVKPVKKKYDRRKADDFLSGLEEGLNFVEQINPLVNRFLKLRG